MLPKPGSQDSSLEVGHPALWEETRQTKKAEDKGRVDAVTQEWTAWSSSSGHGGPFRTKGSLYGKRMRSAWGQGGG